MIVLIAGASHTGKTVLAQKLLEKYKIPYFSIDHLKMGLIRSGNTNLTPEDDKELEAYLWPIIREILTTILIKLKNMQTLWKNVLMIRGVQRNPYSKRMYIILKCVKGTGVIIF